MTQQLWISLGFVLLVSVVVIVSGIKKQPGIGILIALVIIGVSLWIRTQSLDSIGFSPPKNWLFTVLWSIGLGTTIALLSTLVVEPATEKLTGQPHDLSAFEKMRGNWKRLLFMLLVAWILAAFLEESIFRGFLMTELGKLIGTTGAWASLCLLLSSIVFGLAHWYQGKSGALSTGIIALLIGNIFIWSGYNLWMPILTHAVIDTIGLLLIYFNADIRLNKLVWKEDK
jgi:membrane protease YdiL (CAAX protease family)